MKGFLVDKKQEAPHTYSYIFRTDKKLDYIAGQFIELGITLHPASNALAKRWFSLSSSPTEQHLMITTRIEDGTTEFKATLQALQEGAEVSISGAMGDFVLPIDESIPLVFMASGIGITPYRSIIKWLSDSSQQRNITLLRVVRDGQDKVFEDVFGHYPLTRYVTVQKSASQDILEAESLLQLANNDTMLLYTAGPEPLVESIKNDLITHGFPEQRIVTDFFPGYKNV